MAGVSLSEHQIARLATLEEAYSVELYHCLDFCGLRKDFVTKNFTLLFQLLRQLASHVWGSDKIVLEFERVVKFPGYFVNDDVALF